MSTSSASSFFRSETIQLCNVYVQNEMAFDIVAALGELGIVSFIDLNTEHHLFQRRFTNEILRCDAIDTKLAGIVAQLEKTKISILDISGDELPAPKYRDLHHLEQRVEGMHSELFTLEKNMSLIRETYLKSIENYNVLKKMNQLWTAIDEDNDDDTINLQAMMRTTAADSSAERESRMKSITGLVAAEKMMPLERLLWRFFGRNIYVKIVTLDEPYQTTIEDDAENVAATDDTDQVYKRVFTIYFKGDNVEAKLRRICEAFKAQLFDLPVDDIDSRRVRMENLQKTIIDTRTVLLKSADFYHQLLRTCAVDVNKWRVQTVKFRAIFIALNSFNYDLARKCLIGEMWCPEGDRATLVSLLARFDQTNDYQSPTILDVIPANRVRRTVPTFYRLNKFTCAFQQIVDSYGVADYQEANPAPYTVITFPFLFAIMFGDAGHGTIMLLFALWMVLYERRLAARKIRDEIWQMFFSGRYIILLMGAFSIYTGLMYNDIFSKSLNLFGSSFGPTQPGQNNKGEPWYENTSVVLQPDHEYSGTPYPFGIDPIWQLAQNRILFLNSYKMKLSVILGVMQMAFGVTLSLTNHIHFRRTVNIFCEFIPQMIFLFNIFGYMNIMIFAKWFAYSHKNAQDAPSILINLINMFLMKYQYTGPIYLRPWYPGQKPLQIILLVIALICVPWILFPKVLYLRLWKNRRGDYRQFVDEPQLSSSPSASSPLSSSSSCSSNLEHHQDEEQRQGGCSSPSPSPSSGISKEDNDRAHAHEQESFGDAIIHQAIHTIEYCLGSISHTASYLRLWALSLAHSELSEVLWQMVLRSGIAASSGNGLVNGLMMYGAFAFWAVLSVAVLIVMEGLSAFLHALRLHWVEFQSKFYTGSGVKFEPFSFAVALVERDLD